MTFQYSFDSTQVNWCEVCKTLQTSYNTSWVASKELVLWKRAISRNTQGWLKIEPSTQSHLPKIRLWSLQLKIRGRQVLSFFGPFHVYLVSLHYHRNCFSDCLAENLFVINCPSLFHISKFSFLLKNPEPF